MKKCGYEDQIDLYLLNKLSENQKAKFEEHYFNCPACFQKTEQRNILIETVKMKGADIFAPEASSQAEQRVPWTEKALSYFTPRQWAAAAISAALILVVVLAVVPKFKQAPYEFVFTGDETIRGAAMTVIAPTGDLPNVPDRFEWKALGENVEYRVTLSNHKVMWTGTTTKPRSPFPKTSGLS